MNILILGASGGIGSAIFSALRKENHTFFLQYHTKEKKTDLMKHDRTKQVACHYIAADLSKMSEITKLTRFVKSKGGADVIIHSVSLPTKTSSVINKSWSDFQQHLDIQIKSLFHIVKDLSPQMKVNKFGRVIALASEYTIGRPPVKLSDYIVAKYALVGLIKTLAVELGESGITANCVSAGLTPTELTSHLPNKLKEIIANQTPLRKLTSPQDIAALITFLSSSEASMITGENILINGGYTMK